MRVCSGSVARRVSWAGAVLLALACRGAPAAYRVSEPGPARFRPDDRAIFVAAAAEVRQMVAGHPDPMFRGAALCLTPGLDRRQAGLTRALAGALGAPVPDPAREPRGATYWCAPAPDTAGGRPLVILRARLLARRGDTAWVSFGARRDSSILVGAEARVRREGAGWTAVGSHLVFM